MMYIFVYLKITLIYQTLTVTPNLNNVAPQVNVIKKKKMQMPMISTHKSIECPEKLFVKKTFSVSSTIKNKTTKFSKSKI